MTANDIALLQQIASWTYVRQEDKRVTSLLGALTLAKMLTTIYGYKNVANLERMFEESNRFPFAAKNPEERKNMNKVRIQRWSITAINTLIHIENNVKPLIRIRSGFMSKGRMGWKSWSCRGCRDQIFSVDIGSFYDY